MKRAWIAIALCCGACNGAGTEPAAGPAASPSKREAVSQNAPAAARPAAAQSTAAAAAPAGGPTIPAGARWTIFCDSITGEDHVARATALKEVLVKNARARDWYVIHQEGRSSIYLGYYKEIDAAAAGRDPATRADVQRAKADKEVVESIPNPRAPDRKLFPRAQFAQLDSPDPDAPPEWSLTNAPGFFSVQIAAFTGGGRKQNVVEAVRQARAMKVDAYYYHGETTSSLCVGTWPATAIKRQDAAGAVARDENDVIVVNMTERELTAAERQAMSAGGGAIKEFQAKAEILDPSLKATLDQYPEHAVDGEVQMMRGTDKRTGQTVLRPRRSFVVQVPRATLRTTGDFDAEAAAPAAPRGRGTPVDLGARLRGIGQ